MDKFIEVFTEVFPVMMGIVLAALIAVGLALTVGFIGDKMIKFISVIIKEMRCLK